MNVNVLEFYTCSVQNQASSIGLYKSSGAQLNEYLKTLFFSLGVHDLPDSDAETYQFTNDEFAVANLLLVVTDPNTTNGKQQLQAFLQSPEG